MHSKKRIFIFCGILLHAEPQEDSSETEKGDIQEQNREEDILGGMFLKEFRFLPKIQVLVRNFLQ